MSDGVKAAVIGGIFTLVGAIIGASATYLSGSGDTNTSKKIYEKLESDYIKLEGDYNELKNNYEKTIKSNSSTSEIGITNNDNSSNEDMEPTEIWLEDLTPISCIYKDGSGNGALSCTKWFDEKDNGGNIYNHGVYIGDSYNALFYTSVVLVYNLENKYSNMEGIIVLSEQGKNQSGEAILKIIADDDLENPKFVTQNNVSPGFLPEKFNIDVTNVRKLTFILDNVDGVGYWSRDFGIVNAKLY